MYECRGRGGSASSGQLGPPAGWQAASPLPCVRVCVSVHVCGRVCNTLSMCRSHICRLSQLEGTSESFTYPLKCSFFHFTINISYLLWASTMGFKHGLSTTLASRR